MSSAKRLPTVLITNDDGPPTDMAGGSPFVYPFARAMKKAGFKVSVVVPSSQRSWVSKSYLIAQITTGEYYYPRGELGLEGERSELPRPLKDGEDMEWILLNGTPATCSSVALHNLFPPGSFDLVVAGPNFGRNTSTAFAMSSGTIGAAMSASLSGTPSIALSWGLMAGYKTPSDELVTAATDISCKLVKQLWEMGFGDGPDKPDLYSVNVPLMPAILADGGPEIQWTEMAKTQYHRLFKSTAKASTEPKDAGGPAAVPLDKGEETSGGQAADDEDALKLHDEHLSTPLSFKFAPDISHLVTPSPESIAEGSDTHAVNNGVISVVPLKTAFAFARPPAPAQMGAKWRL